MGKPLQGANIASKSTKECLRHSDQLEMRNGGKATPAPAGTLSFGNRI